MTSQVWKTNIALLWSALGIPLGCACIGSTVGSLARALSEPSVSMDYAPLGVLGAWAVVLYGLAVMVRLGTGGNPRPRTEVASPGRPPFPAAASSGDRW